MDEVLRNVERCRAHRDFTTFDGASPVAIDAAEDALGVALPAPLRTMLAATNGLGVLGGWLNWFGVGDDAVVDLVAFNRPDGWLAALPPDWLDGRGVTWVGVRWDHALLGLRGDEVVFVSLLAPDAEQATADVAMPLTRGLAGQLSRGVRRSPDRPWRRAVRRIGGLALDEGLVLGPGHYADGIADTSIVEKVALHDALVLAAELAADRSTGPELRPVRTWPSRWVRRRARLRLALAHRGR